MIKAMSLKTSSLAHSNSHWLSLVGRNIFNERYVDNWYAMLEMKCDSANIWLAACFNFCIIMRAHSQQLRENISADDRSGKKTWRQRENVEWKLELTLRGMRISEKKRRFSLRNWSSSMAGDVTCELSHFLAEGMFWINYVYHHAKIHYAAEF